MIHNVFGGIQSAVHKKKGRENPRQQDEARIHVLQHFEFLVPARAPVENHGDGQSDKENHAEYDQHEIHIERRINLADVGKCQRPGKKYPSALQESAAKHHLGGRGSEPARGTLIRGSR